MGKEFVENYLTMLLDEGVEFDVQVEDVSESFAYLNITVPSQYIGAVVGKRGMLKNAIKTVINGCKAKSQKVYKINVKES
jgi:predicted RNA-binding protein YlqC (UPF0109 family)